MIEAQEVKACTGGPERPRIVQHGQYLVDGSGNKPAEGENEVVGQPYCDNFA